MAIETPIPQQRCISYKKREAKYYYDTETELCEDLGLGVSDLYKFAIRKLKTDRQLLQVVQEMKQVKVSAVVYQMIVELSKSARKSPENFIGDLITTTYSNK